MESCGRQPRLVSYPSGELTLRGHLYRPQGSGPFPAMIWNHGSERDPGPVDELGEFYASAGYVLFAPQRRGHGGSSGEYAIDTVPARARAQSNDAAGYRRKGIELVIELHEAHLQDTVAAVGWLRKQPFVDARRMAMSGVSHGGIQTLLAAEADARPNAYVPFSPAATGWRGNPELQSRLVRATRQARAPIFLLQAENDHSLGPSEVLGAELRKKGPPNRTGVYPAYGQSRASGHGAFALEGTDVWGADVCAFLGQVLQHSPAAA